MGQEATAEHVISSDRAFYVHLQAGFRPTSQLAIVYSSFRHGGMLQSMGTNRTLGWDIRAVPYMTFRVFIDLNIFFLTVMLVIPQQ